MSGVWVLPLLTSLVVLAVLLWALAAVERATARLDQERRALAVVVARAGDLATSARAHPRAR